MKTYTATVELTITIERGGEAAARKVVEDTLDAITSVTGTMQMGHPVSGRTLISGQVIAWPD